MGLDGAYSESDTTSTETVEGDDRLAMIADLLADLPQAERRAVIADLAPTDRAAIARLLIDTVNSKDEENV